MNVALAIIGHLVGDYLIQNDWMALGKKRSSAICAIHCALWTLAVAVVSGCFIPWVLAFLFVTHFAQDRTGFVAWYMKTIGQPNFLKAPLAPWSIIVVDNTFHLLVIAIAARSIGAA